MRSSPRNNLFKDKKKETAMARVTGKVLGSLISRFQPDTIIDSIDFPLKKFGDRK